MSQVSAAIATPDPVATDGKRRRGFSMRDSLRNFIRHRFRTRP